MIGRMLLLGANGLLGRAMRPLVERRGWSTTVVARHADQANGVLGVTGNEDLREIVSSQSWDTIIDFRAYDAPSTQVVVEALRPDSVYILVSSIYVYCHPRTFPDRDLRGLSEDALLTPTGPYGIGKAAAEEGTLARAATDDIYVVRMPFVFGFGDRTQRTERMWRLALTTSEVEGDHIEVGLVPANVVTQRLVALAEQRPSGRHTLNVDGGQNWTLCDHLQAARRAFAGRTHEPPPSLELPFNPARDYSLDSMAVHKLLDIKVENDIGRGWSDVAASW